jgi:hypothetical protein
MRKSRGVRDVAATLSARVCRSSCAGPRVPASRAACRCFVIWLPGPGCGSGASLVDRVGAEELSRRCSPLPGM